MSPVLRAAVALALNYEMLLLPRTVRPRSSECAAQTRKGRAAFAAPFSRGLIVSSRPVMSGLLGYPGKRHRTGARPSDSNPRARTRAALLTSRFIQIACMLTPTSAARARRGGVGGSTSVRSGRSTHSGSLVDSGHCPGHRDRKLRGASSAGCARSCMSPPCSFSPSACRSSFSPRTQTGFSPGPSHRR